MFQEFGASSLNRRMANSSGFHVYFLAASFCACAKKAHERQMATRATARPIPTGRSQLWAEVHARAGAVFNSGNLGSSPCKKCTTRRQELASESGGPRVRKRASEFQKQPPLSLEWEITARPGACLGRRYQTGNSI